MISVVLFARWSEIQRSASTRAPLSSLRPATSWDLCKFPCHQRLVRTSVLCLAKRCGRWTKQSRKRISVSSLMRHILHPKAYFRLSFLCWKVSNMQRLETTAADANCGTLPFEIVCIDQALAKSTAPTSAFRFCTVGCEGFWIYL